MGTEGVENAPSNQLQIIFQKSLQTENKQISKFMEIVTKDPLKQITRETKLNG